ncbi:MAG TPA: PH domain-containing protein [Acidimicrobiales bacterium]|nr:PH domain-containing protein [Acidimicrobiales bacterium]
MAFPSKLLNDNEEVVLDLRPHWIYMVQPVLAIVGAIILGIVILDLDISFTKIPAAVVVLGCLAWFGIRYLKWSSTNFVVTTDRVIHRVGVISKHGVEIPLDRINTVFFHQSVFERLIGAGDLGIESAGEKGSETFEDVRKPAIVQNEIYRQMEANSNRIYGGGRHAAPTQPDAGHSIPEQIEKLDELRRKGVISEQEFAAKKADLLNRM